VTFATDAAELVVTAGEITTKIASFVRARAVLTSNGAPLLSK